MFTFLKFVENLIIKLKLFLKYFENGNDRSAEISIKQEEFLNLTSALYFIENKFQIF